MLSLQKINDLVSHKKYSDLANEIAFLFFCLLIIDCSITGSGRWLMLGPLSLRMLLGLCAFILILPNMFINIKYWIKNPMCISLLLFLIYLIICAFIGIKNGNSTELILSDIKGFSWLFLVPVALSCINSREKFHFLLKTIIAASVFLAIVMLSINIFCTFNSNGIAVVYDPALQLGFGFIDNVSKTICRLFFKSGPYLIVGIIVMFYFQIVNKKFNWLLTVCTGINLSAILFTFTRSFYGSCVLAVLTVIILFFLKSVHDYKRILFHFAIAIFIAVILINTQSLFSGGNYFKFAISRTFLLDVQINPDETDNDILSQQSYIERTKISDSKIREMTLRDLKKMIKQNPVFGNGLGTAIDYREDGLVEYFYYDIINKTGFVGFILYFFPIYYMIYQLKRKWNHIDIQIAIALFSCLLVFLLTTYFNPFMNSSIGISCYSITIAFFYMMNQKNPKGI